HSAPQVREKPPRPGLSVRVACRVRLRAHGADADAARGGRGPRGRAGGAARDRRPGRGRRGAPAVTNAISFMSANYVARQTGYAMHGWGHGDRTTNDWFRPLETYRARFDELLGDVRALGFDTIA